MHKVHIAMQILTKQNVKYNSELYRFEHLGEADEVLAYWASREYKGVTRRLYGKRKTPPNASMQAGTAMHERMEADESSKIACLLAWQEQMAPAQIFSEVFVAGKLCDKGALGFIDSLMLMPNGNALLIDYKTTSRKLADFQHNEFLSHGAKMQLACYANLLWQFYGLKTQSASIIYLPINGDNDMLEVQMGKPDIAKAFAIAVHKIKQISQSAS